MSKINEIIVFACFASFFYTCKSSLRQNEICDKNIKTLRALVYTNHNRPSALDSALHLANESMQCDSIRMEVVDYKWRILATRKRYAEGILFIDSLKESDFPFAYKQSFLSKGLRALEYNSQNDTVKRNLMYKEIADDIAHYLKKRAFSDAEFEDIYSDLFDVKEKYLNATQINKEIDSLIMIFPKKQSFFDANKQTILPKSIN